MATENTVLAALDSLIEADKVSPKQILVIGDGMTDVYVYGMLIHTCQDHCPKFIEESRVIVPGGAANAARSIEGWGARIMLFRQNGPIKTRFMVNRKCSWRHDLDRPGGMADLSTMRKQAHLAVESGRYAGVLLSDYDKGMLTPQLIEGISLACKSLGIPCVADCKRGPELYKGCILKGNTEWTAKNGIDNGVSTHGVCNPCVWTGAVPWGLGYDLPPVLCVNHVGAGDCFAAHLVLGLAYGLSLRESAAIAHSAGRVYVQHPHNRPPTLEEIRRDVESGHHGGE